MRTTGSLLSSERYQSTFTTRTEINGESAKAIFRDLLLGVRTIRVCFRCAAALFK